MGPNIIPEYRKQYTTGDSKPDKSVSEIRSDIIKEIVSLPPILARGHFDEFITLDTSTNPPVVNWDSAKFQYHDMAFLLMIKNILENRHQIETKRY